MLRLISNSIRKFRSDQAGNIAIMFAITAPVMIVGIAATVDYSNTVTIRQETQAAADSAAVAATTAMVNSLTKGSAITIAQAQTIASNFFAANAPAQAISAQTSFTPTTTYSGGVVTTTVSYVGAPTSFIGSALSSSATISVSASSSSTVTTTAGGVNGTGWIAEDPVVEGADGSYGFMEVCDLSHNTWYNLVSDTQFEVNANCDGDAIQSDPWRSRGRRARRDR